MKSVENIFLCIEWRDEVESRRKARAIQRVIDKKVEVLSEKDLIMLKITAQAKGKRISAW